MGSLRNAKMSLTNLGSNSRRSSRAVLKVGKAPKENVAMVSSPPNGYHQPPRAQRSGRLHGGVGRNRVSSPSSGPLLLSRYEHNDIVFGSGLCLCVVPLNGFNLKASLLEYLT